MSSVFIFTVDNVTCLPASMNCDDDVGDLRRLTSPGACRVPRTVLVRLYPDGGAARLTGEDAEAQEVTRPRSRPLLFS